jgi:hypothetical protein
MRRIAVTFEKGLDSHNPEGVPAGAGVFVRDCDLEAGYIKPRPDPLVVSRVDGEGRAVSADPRMYLNIPCLSAFRARLPSGKEVLLVLEPFDHAEKKWARIRVLRDLHFEGETAVGGPNMQQNTGANGGEYIITKESNYEAYLQCSEPVEWLQSGPYVYITNAQPPDWGKNHQPYQIDLRNMLGSDSACSSWPKLKHACIYKGFVVGSVGTNVYWSDPQTGDNLYTWTDGYYDPVTGGLGDEPQRLVVLRDKVFVLTTQAIFMYDGLPTEDSWRKSRIADIGTFDPGSVQVVESRRGGGWIYFLGSDNVPRRTDGTFHNVQVVGGFGNDGQSPVKNTIGKYHTLAAVGGGRTQMWASSVAWVDATFDDTGYNAMRAGVTLDYADGQFLTEEKQENFDPVDYQIPVAGSGRHLWQQLKTAQDQSGGPFYKGMLLMQIDVALNIVAQATVRVRLCKRPPAAPYYGVWNVANNYPVGVVVQWPPQSEWGGSATYYISLQASTGQEPLPGGTAYWGDVPAYNLHANYDSPVAEGTITEEFGTGTRRWYTMTFNRLFADMRVNSTDLDGYNLYFDQVSGAGYAMLPYIENFGGHRYARGNLWIDEGELHEYCCAFRLFSGAYLAADLVARSGSVKVFVELEEGEVMGDLTWARGTVDEHDSDSSVTAFHIYISVNDDPDANWVEITDEDLPLGLTKFLPATTMSFYIRVDMTRYHPAYSPNLFSMMFYPRSQAALPENFVTSLMWRDKYILCLNRNPDIAEDSDLGWSEAPPLTYERPDAEVGRDMLVFEPTGAWTLWDSVGANFANVMHDIAGKERMVYVDCKDVSTETTNVKHGALLVFGEKWRDLNYRPARPAFITGALVLEDGFNTGRIFRALASFRHCFGSATTTLALWSWTAGGNWNRWRRHTIPTNGQPGFRNYLKMLRPNNGRWAMIAVGVDILPTGAISRVQLPIEVLAVTLEVSGEGYRTGTTDGRVAIGAAQTAPVHEA